MGDIYLALGLWVPTALCGDPQVGVGGCPRGTWAVSCLLGQTAGDTFLQSFCLLLFLFPPPSHCHLSSERTTGPSSVSTHMTRQRHKHTPLPSTHCLYLPPPGSERLCCLVAKPSLPSLPLLLQAPLPVQQSHTPILRCIDGWISQVS